MKKLVSMCLAAIMTVALAAPAFAVTDPAPTQKVSGGSGNVTLNGNVSNDPAALISVTLPLSIDFTVATTETDEYFSGITHAKGDVINHSSSPVTMKVSNVVDSNGILPLMDLALAPVSVVGTSTVVNGETTWTIDDSKAFQDSGKYWLNKVSNKTDGVTGTPVELFSSLAADGGKDMLTTCGRKTNGSTNTKIPTGTYTVVTTITIGLDTTPAP